ncbi:MAG: glycosyltransferase family 39 protein [Parvularculaceae bacterium]
MTVQDNFYSTPGRQFALVAAALTLARIISLIFGAPNLGPDETQYWFWSLTPDFGYYSKPPLIAWSIAATTALFGQSEWAVRLSAPLYHLGAASILYFLARRLANPRAGFWAGIVWLTLPGVFLSAALITTDAPLMFFQAGALFFFFRLISSDSRKMDAAALGAMIGFGMLAKYAMIYFVIAAAIALILIPAIRKGVSFKSAVTVIAIALIVLAPNIAWNAAHDFDTLSHTAANADWGGAIGHPANLIKFLGDQIAIAGPILIVLIIISITSAIRDKSDKAPGRRALVIFSLMPIAIVAAQAVISRAHGNWAAAAYPSAVVLAAIWASSNSRSMMATRTSVALHSMIGIGFLIVFTNFAIADAIGAGTTFKRLRGWDQHGPEIQAIAKNYSTILVDDREITGELVYYTRGGPPVVAWNSNGVIDNHYEAFRPFVPKRDEPALFVTDVEGAPAVKDSFGEVRFIGTSTAKMSPTRQRTLYLYALSNYSPERFKADATTR